MAKPRTPSVAGSSVVWRQRGDSRQACVLPCSSRHPGCLCGPLGRCASATGSSCALVWSSGKLSAAAASRSAQRWMLCASICTSCAPCAPLELPLACHWRQQLAAAAVDVVCAHSIVGNCHQTDYAPFDICPPLQQAMP
eukprot:351055-Chlamydomonas_euryale.AAC.2